MIPFEKFKIQLYKLITGGILRQLIILFVFFLLVFEILALCLNMESSWLFHNMTTFDYPPKDNQLTLQLLYLIGVVFFSGFLVMILTNGARNKIDMYKSGDVRLRLKNKITILGFNKIALGVINEHLRNDEKKKCNIEIIVEEGVSKIREIIDGIYGSNNRIYILHGSRNSTNDISTFHLEDSKAVFIVGEKEENTDIKNLECYSTICKQDKFVACNIYLYLYEQASFTLILNRTWYSQRSVFDYLHLNIVNSDEIWSRSILIEPNVSCCERSLYNREGKCPTAQSDYYVHLLIFGMTDVGEVLAKTAALSCHFPNFITKGIRTKITVIDDDFSKNRGIFGGRYSDFLKLCHYSLRSIKNGQIISHIVHDPQKYEDLLDIEWDFIESVADDSLLQSELSKLCDDENGILTTIVCYNNDAKNINTALGLPRIFFDVEIPIWLYLKKEYSLGNYLQESRYRNITIWGMLGEKKENKWYESTAKILNQFDYYCGIGHVTNYQAVVNDELDTKWSELSLDFKMGYIDLTLGLPSMYICTEALFYNKIINNESMYILERMEHVKWMTSVVLRGFRPFTEKQKKENEDNNIGRLFMDKFYHADINYYEKTDATLRKKNQTIIKLYQLMAPNWKEKFKDGIG